MKKLLAAALLCALAIPAQAQTFVQPPCLPKQWGSTGSDFKTGAIDGFEWLGWTCVVSGKVEVHGFVWQQGYVLHHPDTTGMTVNQMYRAYMARNINPTDNRPGFVTARQVMRMAFGQ